MSMSQSQAPDGAMRGLAWALGAAGLLPFFGNALFAWVAPVHELDGLLRSQVHYAGAILGFLGALHWGVVLGARRPFTPRDGGRLVWSVLPALLAWVVTLYPPAIALPVLFFALPVVLFADFLLYRDTPVPGWFLWLRSLLTVVATGCVGASWLAMGSRVLP